MGAKWRRRRGGIGRTVLNGAGLLVLVILLILLALRLAAWSRESAVPPPPATAWYATPLGRVAAQVSGPPDGPPIVIVHGTAAWSGFWTDVAGHFAARGWRVVAVDLPPFGWSDRDPKARYARGHQAERLSGVVAAQGRPAVVLGHSFGGGPVTELALRHPDRLRGIVLVDAALGQLDPAGEAGAAKVLRTRPIAELATSATVTNPAALGPLLRSMIARKDQARRWLPVLRAPMRREGSTTAYASWLPNLFTRHDGALSRRSAELSRIRVPVALIWGEADTVTPLDRGRRIAQLTRARSLAVLPGVGHIPHIEHPEAFIRALDQALASLDEKPK
jgi:pimeloyl-ACP methyl ester carboxylesterase